MMVFFRNGDGIVNMVHHKDAAEKVTHQFFILVLRLHQICRNTDRTFFSQRLCRLKTAAGRDICDPIFLDFLNRDGVCLLDKGAF